MDKVTPRYGNRHLSASNLSKNVFLGAKVEWNNATYLRNNKKFHGKTAKKRSTQIGCVEIVIFALSFEKSQPFNAWEVGSTLPQRGKIMVASHFNGWEVVHRNNACL